MGTLSLDKIRLTISASAVAKNNLSGASAFLNTANASFSLTPTLANGTAANQADVLWMKEGGTLTGAASVLLDVYDGANFDGRTTANGQLMGDAQTMAEGIAILVLNRSTSTGNIDVGGDGATTAWNTPFGGNDATLITIKPGGGLLLFSPVNPAYAIADTTNHLLSIASTANVTYDVLVLGRSA